MTKEALLSMEIGETIFDSSMGNIHRTIGGWIYQDCHVFVPFADDEKKNESEIVKKGRPRKGLDLITK